MWSELVTGIKKLMGTFANKRWFHKSCLDMKANQNQREAECTYVKVRYFISLHWELEDQHFLWVGLIPEMCKSTFYVLCFPHVCITFPEKTQCALSLSQVKIITDINPLKSTGKTPTAFVDKLNQLPLWLALPTENSRNESNPPCPSSCFSGSDGHAQMSQQHHCTWEIVPPNDLSWDSVCSTGILRASLLLLLLRVGACGMAWHCSAAPGDAAPLRTPHGVPPHPCPRLRGLLTAHSVPEALFFHLQHVWTGDLTGRWDAWRAVALVSSVCSGRLAKGMAIFFVALAALLVLDAGLKFLISFLRLVCQWGNCNPTGKRDVCFPVDQLRLLWILLTSY